MPQDLNTNDRDNASDFSPVHNSDFLVCERKDEFANKNRNTSGQFEDSMTPYDFTSVNMDNSNTLGG